MTNSLLHNITSQQIVRCYALYIHRVANNSQKLRYATCVVLSLWVLLLPQYEGVYSGEGGGWKDWETGDVGSDDSGMETILDGEDEEEGTQTEQKQGAQENHFAALLKSCGMPPDTVWHP